MKREKKERKWNEKWIGNQMGDEGAKRISESLKINTSLTILHLDSDEEIRNEKRKSIMKEMKKWVDNQIGNEGAKSISESLKINPLTSLNLGGDENEVRNEKEMKNE